MALRLRGRELVAPEEAWAHFYPSPNPSPSPSPSPNPNPNVNPDSNPNPDSDPDPGSDPDLDPDPDPNQPKAWAHFYPAPLTESKDAEGRPCADGGGAPIMGVPSPDEFERTSSWVKKQVL